MATKKNTAGKQANGICYLCIVLFILYAFCITFFYNWDFLSWAEEISLFLPTRSFFGQTMQTAGGLLNYVGLFLTQFFYYPLLGSIILIVLLLFVVFLVVKAFEFSPRFYPLAFVPALALLTSVTEVGYVLYSLKSPGYLFSNIFGIIICLLIIWGFRAIGISRHSGESRNLLKKGGLRVKSAIITAIILTYPLFGFYALLAALLCMLSGKHKGLPFLLLCFAPLLLLIPYLCSRYLYTTMAWCDTFTAALPKFYFNKTELSLWIPFILIALFSFFAVIFCKFAPDSKHGKQSKAALFASLGIFLISLAGAYSLSCRNNNFKTELQMAHAIDNSDWRQVVSISEKQKENPTRLIIMCYNLAQYKLGQAGDRMFAMDNNSVFPVSSRQNLILMHNGAKQLYYQYGKINYAYRWCMEDMVEYGMTVQDLKYMVKCALINKEWALAAKYNAVLKQTLFHKQWAEEYQKYIDNPKLMTENSEFKAIYPLMAYQNLPDGDNSKLELYILNSFAYMEGGTPEIVELSLQCNLILKNIERFWPRFFLYARTHNRIPVHYQEAALLYSYLEHKVDVSRIPFDPVVIERFHRLLAMSQQYANMPEEYNKKAFKPQFGTTFWYYYFFITDIKTN